MQHPPEFFRVRDERRSNIWRYDFHSPANLYLGLKFVVGSLCKPQVVYVLRRVMPSEALRDI